MKNDNRNSSLLGWYQSLNRLVDKDDWKAMDTHYPGISYHTEKIKKTFELEDEVSEKYNRYILIPFHLSGDITHEGISTFIQRYQQYRNHNKLIRDRDIAYCWGLNDIYNNIDFRFFGFYSLDKKTTDKEIDDLIYTVKSWMNGVKGLQSMIFDSHSVLDAVIVDTNIIVDTNNFRDRNKARYLLATMNVTDNEKMDSDPRHIRKVRVSTVKQPTHHKSKSKSK